MKKKIAISTELFEGKVTPPFINDHPLFRKPVQVKKVFPSIGMPNFSEKANIDKCLVDVKKEGSYVHNLLQAMTAILNSAKDGVSRLADKFQYLDSKEERDAAHDRITELYSLVTLITTLASCTDPYNRDVLESAIQTTEGKIALILMKNIVDSNDKPICHKGQSLFKMLNKVKEKCDAFGVNVTALDQTDAFKIFSKENIPNKEFSIIFSSEGKEGAWDLLTMSMRGIKSCQRWDGEYPRCLIGSVLSKFVGLMYLTSGVQSDANAGYKDLGSKMMRRCVVRYAIDADEGKPCILLDKMYPELDTDVLGIFVASIKSKTDLPVYYSQDLANKVRHIYIPSEKMREEMSNRDWSYQDTPLKSKHDLNIYLLMNNKDELTRDVRGFKLNLALFVAKKMEAVYNNAQTVDPEIKKTINNMRMNISFTPFCEAAVSHILSGFRFPEVTTFTSSSAYYRKYLMELLTKRKTILSATKGTLQSLLQDNTSRTVNIDMMVNYIFSLVTEFTKLEISKLIN